MNSLRCLRFFALAPVLFALVHAPALSAQVPPLLSYQGRVAVNGVNFNGSPNGQFKFALVDTAGTTTYWSNDGTGTSGSEPTTAVSLPVVQGLYSVLLGDTSLAHMTTIPNAVFSHADVRLRVWFNDGTHGSQLVTPDQRIASAGYAMVAGSVPNGAISSVMLGSDLTLSGITFLSGILNVSTCFTVEPRPNSTGGLNTFIGPGAGQANTTGLANTFIGNNAGKNNVGGSSNCFYGLNAGASNTSGQFNVFLGQGAGAFNDSGSNNNFVGQGAGFNAFNASSNNFFGWHAGFATSTGSNNAFFGDQAGLSNNASNNAFFGSGAGSMNNSGTQDCFFGINAGNKTTGSFNSFFGAGAGQFTTSGVGNTFMGNIAGTGVNTGTNNSFFGGNTGSSFTGESHNTLLGDSTDGSSGIANSTAVGANAKVTASNSLVLGSINGTNGATSDTNVGIGTTSPNSTLQVKGSMSVAIRVVSASPLIGLSSSDCVLVVTGAGASSVGLPGPVAGRIYIVKNRSSGLITLGPLSGTATIDGNATLTIASTSGVAQVVSDGTNWFKIN